MGNISNLLKPTKVSFFKDKEVTLIAAGSFHSLAVCAD
jgi:hypothetical protein